MGDLFNEKISRFFLLFGVFLLFNVSSVTLSIMLNTDNITDFFVELLVFLIFFVCFFILVFWNVFCLIW